MSERGGAAPRSAAAERPLAIVADPLRLLLFLLTVVTISRVHQHYPQLRALRPALLLVIASIAYAYLHPAMLTRANVLNRWPMRLVAALGILACCSAAFGISLGASANFILGSYLKTIAYAFLIAVSIRHVRDLYTFVWAYVISCGILTFFSLFVFGISKASGSYVTRLSNMYTYDANDLGVVILVGFALTMLLMTVGTRMQRWFLVLNLVGIAAAIARSGSRGGFLGLGVLSLAALVLVNSVPLARRVSLLVAALIALGFAAPPGYWKQMGTILEPKSDYNYTSIDGRKALMQRGLGYVAQYPVFGLGINNFPRAECSIAPKLESLRANGPMRCTPPHNSYLQALTELGIPGFLVWLSLVAGAVVAPLRMRRRLPRSWRRGSSEQRFIYAATSFLPLATIGFAVPAFFLSFAWMDPIYLIAALVCGLYVAVDSLVHTASRPLGDSAPRGYGWRVARSHLHPLAAR